MLGSYGILELQLSFCPEYIQTAPGLILGLPPKGDRTAPDVADDRVDLDLLVSSFLLACETG